MNINSKDLFKNVQKLQDKMEDFKDKLGEIVITGSAGGGMVEVDMNGKQEMIAIRITPEVTGDLEMLQDLVLAAYTSALEKVKDVVKDEMGGIANIFSSVMPDGFPII
jgi:DNA-binding YbaB/EbfC family protein